MHHQNTTFVKTGMSPFTPLLRKNRKACEAKSSCEHTVLEEFFEIILWMSLNLTTIAILRKGVTRKQWTKNLFRFWSSEGTKQYIFCDNMVLFSRNLIKLLIFMLSFPQNIWKIMTNPQWNIFYVVTFF